MGALPGCAITLNEADRLSAKYVPRVIAGANPKDLPVEEDRSGYQSTNGKQIGLTIPYKVLARADKVIK